MTGTTYVYLTACVVLFIWAGVMAAIAIHLTSENRKLSALNRVSDRRNDELEEKLKDALFLKKSKSHKYVSGTNTDYLIEEEEYA